MRPPRPLIILKARIISVGSDCTGVDIPSGCISHNIQNQGLFPPCCKVLRYIGCCCLKIENGQTFHATLICECCIMLRSLFAQVQYCTRPATILHPVMGTSSIYTKCRSLSQQGGQTQATRRAQQCFPIVLPELASVWPTM